VNPRFMLAMTRMKLNERNAESDRRAAGQKAFNTMSQGVKVLSRLQLPADLVARVTRSAHADDGPAPEVVLYLGCNVMKTPHIALLCMDVLDRIGARYKVSGGPANCCGVIQFRSGDPKTAGRVGGNSVAGFKATGAPRVLTWCPTCNIQLGEIVMPTMPEPPFALEHVIPYIADRLDRLTPHFVRPVNKRVALHEHPGVAGVTEGVLKILGAIPGLTVVDLAQPRVGYMCNSLAPVAAYKRELHAQELAAAGAAGVDALVGIYHACHRELCAHEATLLFRVVNFLELVGEAMGVERPDLFKHWKMMQDVDRVLAEVGDQVEREGLDPDAVREVMVASMLGEQPLPLGTPMRSAGQPLDC
jgi:Fe-S oxidoreductase